MAEICAKPTPSAVSPGDEYLTTRNSLDGTSGGAKGNSNVAFISGALETWRAYDPEAI